MNEVFVLKEGYVYVTESSKSYFRIHIGDQLATVMVITDHLLV